MPIELPPKLKKHLQSLRLANTTCSIKHCSEQASGKFKGTYVCSTHYQECMTKYKQSWVIFIAQITNEIIMKMTFTKDERCILDPPSCLSIPQLKDLTLKVTDYIMDNYIPTWANHIVTKTLIKKGVTKALFR